ncbi:hypothetical protein HY480_04720, partial [Candidatus Uhrbacteria bacterium]|nr:hypothetical protein [Candidatus Uhrbacteria bacterium]
MRYGLVVAFIVDIGMKEWVRRLPDVAAHFSFPTPFGAVGIVPSVNRVLAFSLPIPNAWIWPIGWFVVAVLMVKLVRLFRGQVSGVR